MKRLGEPEPAPAARAERALLSWGFARGWSGNGPVLFLAEGFKGRATGSKGTTCSSRPSRKR